MISIGVAVRVGDGERQEDAARVVAAERAGDARPRALRDHERPLVDQRLERDEEEPRPLFEPALQRVERIRANFEPQASRLVRDSNMAVPEVEDVKRRGEAFIRHAPIWI